MSDLNTLPNFSQIDLSNIPTQLKTLLDSNLSAINQLLTQSSFTWDNLMQPLEDLDDQLSQFWSPVGHLNAVMNSDVIREVYNACLPMLSDYGTNISHNQTLYQAIKSIADSDSLSSLSQAQQMVIKHEMRDFKLAGIALPEKQQHQFAALSKELAQLTTKFEENVLDATHAWEKHITDQSELAGLTEHALQTAAAAAASKDKQGWLLTLDAPCYIAVIMHADSDTLRQEIYQAYCTRASDQGPQSGQWDNTAVIQHILEHRLSIAALLGFQNYAERSIATKMVDSTQQVLDFLQQLAESSRESAKQEFTNLCDFAKKELDRDTLNSWDIAYVSEKLRRHSYDISQEDLRPYFPEHKVIEGLFTIVNKLFNITIRAVENADVWHSDARCFGIFDQDNNVRAYCYFDLYARKNKRGGAWMDDCRVRRRLANGEIQLPIAYVNCNFNGPIGDNPALFTHDDVVTLFHEFGHSLQHMLTKIDYSDVSGINGVPWDAVEIASQFLENWAWEKQSLALLTEHHQTKATLPDALYQKMMKAKNFQSAMQMMRQLELSLFDFQLHLLFDPKQEQQVTQVLKQVRAQVAVFPTPAFNRFQHSFSHIFAGGYAAGYYSYKWAEVMAADAFSLFKENGIFDKTTSDKFLHTFLERGGAVEPLELFVEFRGREPQVAALLKDAGIEA